MRALALYGARASTVAGVVAICGWLAAVATPGHWEAWRVLLLTFAIAEPVAVAVACFCWMVEIIVDETYK